MTETTTNHEQSIERSLADIIREDRGPQAARLQHSLKGAEKWIEATDAPDAPGAMADRAETICDKLEEELSCVAWEMEVISWRRREDAFNERRPEELRVEDPKAVSHASCLSNSLAEAYYIVSQAPQELFSDTARGRATV